MRKIFLVVCFFLSTSLFSQTNDDMVRTFVKGNISEKIHLIDSLNSDDNVHTQLFTEALSFINDNYSLLSNDADFIRLARAIVQKSSQNGLSTLLPQLMALFQISDIDSIKLDLLTVFSSITSDTTEIVGLINEYANSLLTDSSYTDITMLSLTLEVLGNFANAQSFPVLFQAYAYNDNDEIIDIASQSLSKLGGGNENQIRELIENGTSREKYYTLQLVLNNSNNSDFFRAEMSEKALSGTIIYIGDVSAVDNYTVELQMIAIRELVRISWTRSANLITDFYLVAKDEFEAGTLSEDNFAEIINAFTTLSSGSAGEHLAMYLEELNKQQEENKAYSETIVLAVIQSLGQLGNKVAFDALLYTTYLDYPENIILAARDALVTLKW